MSEAISLSFQLPPGVVFNIGAQALEGQFDVPLEADSVLSLGTAGDISGTVVKADALFNAFIGVL